MANVASFVFDDPFFSILQIKQITNVKKITKDRVLLSFFESNQFPNLSQKKIEKISPKLLNKCKILSQLHFQFAFQPSNLSKLIKKQNYSPKEIELISQIALFSFISWTQFCERNGTIDFLDVVLESLIFAQKSQYYEISNKAFAYALEFCISGDNLDDLVSSLSVIFSFFVNTRNLPIEDFKFLSLLLKRMNELEYNNDECFFETIVSIISNLGENFPVGEIINISSALSPFLYSLNLHAILSLKTILNFMDDMLANINIQILANGLAKYAQSIEPMIKFDKCETKLYPKVESLSPIFKYRENTLFEKGCFISEFENYNTNNLLDFFVIEFTEIIQVLLDIINKFPKIVPIFKKTLIQSLDFKSPDKSINIYLLYLVIMKKIIKTDIKENIEIIFDENIFNYSTSNLKEIQILESAREEAFLMVISEGSKSFSSLFETLLEKPIIFLDFIKRAMKNFQKIKSLILCSDDFINFIIKALLYYQNLSSQGYKEIEIVRIKLLSFISFIFGEQDVLIFFIENQNFTLTFLSLFCEKELRRYVLSLLNEYFFTTESNKIAFLFKELFENIPDEIEKGYPIFSQLINFIVKQEAYNCIFPFTCILDSILKKTHLSFKKAYEFIKYLSKTYQFNYADINIFLKECKKLEINDELFISIVDILYDDTVTFREPLFIIALLKIFDNTPYFTKVVDLLYNSCNSSDENLKACCDYNIEKQILKMLYKSDKLYSLFQKLSFSESSNQIVLTTISFLYNNENSSIYFSLLNDIISKDIQQETTSFTKFLGHQTTSLIPLFLSNIENACILFSNLFEKIKESESVFLEQNNTKLILSILLKQKTIIDSDLFIYYNLEKLYLKIRNEKLKLEFFNIILCNYELWKENFEQIILHWEGLLKNDKCINNYFHFDALNNFINYYQKLPSPYKSMSVISEILKNIYISYDNIKLLVSYIFYIPEIDIALLLCDVIHNNKYLAKINKDISSLIITLFAHNSPKIAIKAIDILIDLYEKGLFESISLSNLFNMVIRIISTKAINMNFIEHLIDLSNNGNKLLFSLVFYSSIFVKGSLTTICSTLKFDDSFLQECYWTIFPLISLINSDKDERRAVFEYLLSGAQPLILYSSIDIVSNSFHQNTYQFKYDFFVCLTDMLLEDKINLFYDEYISIIKHFMYFSIDNFNDCLIHAFDESPFKIDSQNKTLNSKIYSNKYDSMLEIFNNYNLRKISLVFVLNIDNDGNWKDLELAKKCTTFIIKKKIIQKHSLSLLLINLHFILKFDKEFAFECISSISCDLISQNNCNAYGLLLYYDMINNNLESIVNYSNFIEENLNVFSCYNQFIKVNKDIYPELSSIKQNIVEYFEEYIKIDYDIPIYENNTKQDIVNNNVNQKELVKLLKSISTKGFPYYKKEKLYYLRDNKLSSNRVPMLMKQQMSQINITKINIQNITKSISKTKRMNPKLKSRPIKFDDEIAFIIQIPDSNDEINCNKITPNCVTQYLLNITDENLIFSPKQQKGKIKVYNRSEIYLIQKKPFLQKKVSLEIYFNTGKSLFIVFNSHSCRNKIFHILENNTNHHSLKEITSMWQEGKLTNFDYLIKINEFGGRSFNSPSQYPIFPWVLSDFCSENIDLSNQNVYRDLSKNMLSINEKRSIALDSFYINLNSVLSKGYYMPYSMMPLTAVFSYLKKIQPFSSILFPNNIYEFNDVSSLYQSSSTELYDFRELIPEFYYFPEFLTQKQIPKWAKSPIDFVYIMRKVLESKYVSEKLPLWIDYIFGIDQMSVDKRNLYDKNLYSNVWDNSNLGTNEKEVIQHKLLFDGQIPKQIFFCKHVNKNENIISFKERVKVQLTDNQIISSSINKNQITIIKSNYLQEIYLIDEECKPILQPFEDTSIFKKSISKILNSNSEYAISYPINSVINVYKLPDFNKVRDFYFFRDDIKCGMISNKFHFCIICCENGEIFRIPLEKGNTYFTISNPRIKNYSPSFVIVTELFGFIICKYDIIRNDIFNTYLSLLNINGVFIRDIVINSQVNNLISWKDQDTGVDYIAYSNKKGEIYYSEAYYLNFKLLTEQTYSKISSMSFNDDLQCFFLVLENGMMIFEPFCK